MPNYYVAKTGNDANPGTLAYPFLTIQKAANVAVAGDTVILRDGTYSYTSTFACNIYCVGTPDNYITFKSENKWGAVLDGNNISSYGISIEAGASYLKFIDFEIKNFLSQGIFCNNSTLENSYITVQGNKIHDIGRISTTSDYGLDGIYFKYNNDHWTITRNLIYNIGRTGPDTYYMNKDHAIYIGYSTSVGTSGAGHVISYNIIYGCSGQAIVDGGTINLLIANNVIAWTNANSMGQMAPIASSAGGDYSTGLTIANNIFYQCSPTENYTIWSPAGISRTGWSVENNIIYGATMWYPGQASEASAKTAMKGNNYGQTDCEKSQVDPKFVSALRVNAPNVDFNLHSDSPAINAGTNVGLTTDYLNRPISTPPDIGAYEYYWSNIEKSTIVEKNDCGSGYNGSSVIYTVLGGSYSSNISQADADSKAIEDISANKQAYANTHGSCILIPLYWNVEQRGSAIKNDCGGGYNGSIVTYTVTAHTYSSIISQEDADNQAIADVNTNKQSYANTNGTCILIPPIIYLSVMQYGVATKNDCSTGYVGSEVNYVVPAGLYSSIISQYDADAKAIDDVNSNKQAYANLYGTCTLIPVTIYYNRQVVVDMTRNNCGYGYTGSTVTYTVPSKKYSSIISQLEADSQAQNDVNINAQNYANTHGTCILIPTKTYYNKQIYITLRRNNCAPGYNGSYVVYIVPAKKYKSFISQVDADAQAKADLNTNAQNYANSHGVCKLNRRTK